MKTTAKQEIMHMLQANVSPPTIVRSIVAETCPYRQEQLTLALQDCWRELEKTFDERAVYQIDTRWGTRWPDMQDTIHLLLQRARSAQAQTLTTPTPTTLNTKHSTLNSKSMPIIIQKQEGSIHNYDHCTFYNTTPACHSQSTMAQKHEDIQDVAPTEEEPTAATSLDAFAAMFTFAYAERRKNDFENMLALIQEPQWENKDRARFALAIYQSGNLIPKTRPASFKEWYQICCNTFGWKIGEYEPRKLTDNQASRQIKMYL